MWYPVALALLLLHGLAAPVLAAGQQPPAGALRVFLDCEACDEDFLRSELTFVDYVRDREVADVHVLVSTESTGGGGSVYELRFLGRGHFEGIEQVLHSRSEQMDTLDTRRRGLARVLALGLVRYVAETPLADYLKVDFEVPRAAAEAATRDPWNFWVFNIGFSGSLSGERSDAQTSLSGTLSGNRTTESWKINLRFDGDYSKQRFEFEEGGAFTTASHSLGASALLARSVSRHWSLGLTTHATSSSFHNYRLRLRVAPGIEYNVFPYSQATQRILTLFYTVGLQNLAYREETLFGRISERLLDHRLTTTLALQQPWGTASASLEFAQFLTRPDKYRLTGEVNLEMRLFKGLSMDVSGNVARRRDQINLPRGAATEEEILVRQRELATDYEYGLNLGFKYTFGSIFNNVVNPRLRGADGF
ncbi:DUF481 domain-containing protein [Archangium violaceum]|uniref:DUF481 domain-containing protein n=1 Tax=Archangium violaceum TaxID=83451 RepID=UPI001951F0E9|nr:DUF481 domain-containing protein [Archangium violaceum]QRN98944.1 DUF481 domain-containing protein [Archangium violaceum]